MTDALALISQAEKALASATHIVEVMELRAVGKAAEAAAIALGLAEVAQEAKVFQLRAERKAGSWLQNHIRHNGGKPSQGDTVIRLQDLDIDRNTSSRWQAIASIPEPKFNEFIDDHLSRGWEVTAGGLRTYARQLQGNPGAAPSLRDILLAPSAGVCALVGYKVTCAGPLTGQHILNKSKARGNEEVRAILAACPEEVMATICTRHNVDRWADQPDARRILLLQNVYRFGWHRMKKFFDDLPWKVPQHDLTIEGMLG
jgi:hypothetical protein